MENIRSRKLTNTCLDYIIEITYISTTDLANFHHNSWVEKGAWILQMNRPYVRSSKTGGPSPS